MSFEGDDKILKEIKGILEEYIQLILHHGIEFSKGTPPPTSV